MGKVTFYLDDETEAKMRATAQASQLPVSQWVVQLIQQELSTQWPAEVVELAGAWPDFPSACQLRTAE